MDTFHRSLVKTIVWRIVATFITFVVTFLFTGEVAQATTITLVVATVLMAGYYLNERIWDKIEWGRKHEAYATHSATHTTQSVRSPRARRLVR